VGWLHNKMKVIRHQADAEHLNGKFRFCLGEQIEEGGVIAVLVENRCTTVPPIQNIVGVNRYLSAWNRGMDK